MKALIQSRFAVLLLAVVSVSASSLYTVTDLGFANGVAINDSGQVTGTAVLGGGSYAFLYSNGVTTNLGTLGGVFVDSTAHGINAAGQVTGDSYSAYSPGTLEADHAFLYSNGVMADLGTLTGQSTSVGYAINDSGIVTG